MNGDEDRPAFVASKTYKGFREGYYFGTGPQGTGYHVDRNRNAATKTLPNSSSSSDHDTVEPAVAEHHPTKKARFDTTQNQTMIIPNRSLLEQAEQEQLATKSIVVDLSPKGLATATNLLAKCMIRNELERAQQDEESNDFAAPDDPSQYMASEIALYEHIVALKSVAASASDLYGVIAASPSARSSEDSHDLLALLCQLLLHPNPDIGISVVSVLLEWMDPSLLEDVNAAVPTTLLARRILLEATDALVDNLDRFNPAASMSNGVARQTTATATTDSNSDDDVGKGTEDVLSLLENLMEIESVASFAANDAEVGRVAPEGESVASYLCRHSRLFVWLLQQVDAVNKGSEDLSSLSSRSMELLANLALREEVYAVLSDWSHLSLQADNINSSNSNVIEDDRPNKHDEDADDGDGDDDDDETKSQLDGIEIILQVVAGYKKKQPSDDAQLEFLENACIVMASALTYSPSNVKAFLACQGIELVIRCIKERVHAGGVAMTWLDFATGKELIHRQAAEHVVDAGALKYLFPIFMGRSLAKQALESNKREMKEWSESLEATVIRIFYGLTRHLRDDSPHDVKARFLAKFVNDEKCDRLVELCISYDQKARMAEFKFYKSEVEDELEDEQAVQLAALNAKLEGGGDLYHRLAAIIAFCCIGSRQCHERILGQLHLHQNGIGLVGDALEEFCTVLDGGEQKDQLQQYLVELL